MLKATTTRSLLLLWTSHLILDFFTGIWPIYKTIANIDIAKAGLIAGLSGFIGESLQLFFGYLSDRGHRKKCMMLGLCLSSCVLMVTFMSDTLSYFAVLVLLMLGSGSYHPSSAGFTGLLSNTRKGRYILIFASGGAIGFACSQLIFTKIISIYNGNALILFIPVLVILALIARYPFTESPQPVRFSLKNFLIPFMNNRRPLLLLYLTQIANFTIVTAFLFLLPDLMRTKNCHHWLCMGGGHLCFILASAITMIPAGYFCDKYGHKSIMLTVLGLAILLFYGFLFASTLSFLSTTLMLVFLGGCLGIVNPILLSWGNKLVPESPSTVSALMMGCAWCFGCLGSTWAGLIAKLIPVQPILMTLYAMGILIAICLIFISFVPQKVLVREQT